VNKLVWVVVEVIEFVYDEVHLLGINDSRRHTLSHK